MAYLNSYGELVEESDQFEEQEVNQVLHLLLYRTRQLNFDKI